MRKLVLIALMIFGGAAHAGVIYENDFSAGAAGWSGGSIVNGEYRQNNPNSTIRFTGGGLLLGQRTVSLFFDINAIGSWDQSGSLQDGFTATNVRLFLPNQVLYDGVLQRGINSFAFYDVGALFEPILDGFLRLRFSSDVTGRDEIFAVDNVRVTVPEPGSFALLALGLAGLALRRRLG